MNEEDNEDELHAGEFDAKDLVKKDLSRCVILASGGPLMHVVSSCTDGTVLCEWEGGMAFFDTRLLRSLVPYSHGLSGGE